MNEPQPTPPSADEAKPSSRGWVERQAQKVERFADANPIIRILKSLRELLILLLWLVVEVVPGLEPSLDVTHEFLRLQPPAATKTFLASADKLDPNSAGRVAADALASPHMLRIRLRNRTRGWITRLDLRITNARQVAAAAVNSDSSAIDSATASAFQLADGTASFPGLREIPPGAEVFLTVWGQFNPPVPFVEGEQVRVSSDASRVRIRETGQATGLGLFVAENMQPLTVLLVAAFLLVGLRRLAR